MTEALYPAIGAWFIAMGLILKSMQATSMKRQLDRVRTALESGQRVVDPDELQDHRQGSAQGALTWVRSDRNTIDILQADGEFFVKVAVAHYPESMSEDEINKAVATGEWRK